MLHAVRAAELRDSRSEEALLGLLREIGDLKRIRSSGRSGSIAERLFTASWGDLVADRPPTIVAFEATAAAVAATRLADLDASCLVKLGLPEAEAIAIQRVAIAEVARVIHPSLGASLEAAIAAPHGGPSTAPAFVAALAAQPRAGVTCPGRARIVLQPAENHAEHCLAVAVIGVLLAPRYGADPATVFLAGLVHHLHNVEMPDAGFTGEMLLGRHLDGVVRKATEIALAQLAPCLRQSAEAARSILADASTPEGRAFHAADVLDRVLEIEQHLRAASLTMGTVLGDMALVHDGPVKPFHDAVLAEFGLL